MALVILRVLLTEAIRVFISFNEGIRYVLKGDLVRLTRCCEAEQGQP